MVDDPDKLHAQMIRLIESATELNRQSDLFSKEIIALNVALSSLNLGIECRTEFPTGNPAYKLFVGYGREGKEWSLMLWQIHEQDEECWLYLKAPRWLRIKAIDYIPQLLEAMVVTTDAAAKRVITASSTARDILKQIQR